MLYLSLDSESLFQLVCFKSRDSFVAICRCLATDVLVSMYEGCLLYFGIWQPQCCNLSTDSSIIKPDIFEVISTQNVLTYERYLCCLQKMVLNREHFHAIIVYNFRRRLTKEILFHISFSARCFNQVLNHGLSFNKPRYYLLNYGDRK